MVGHGRINVIQPGGVPSLLVMQDHRAQEAFNGLDLIGQ